MTTTKKYHLNFAADKAGEYAILTGDPGRVAEIASYLDRPEFVASNREYTTYLGYIGGVPVNVTSVGIGGPSMAIGVEELAAIGVKTFIRIGTSGGIALAPRAGDIVIANAAVRQEGTGREYLPEFFPAVSDFAVTSAIAQTLREAKRPYHVGVVQSKDSFYGEMEPERMPLRENLLNLWECYKRAGVLCSEMECAALFTVAQTLRVRAGAMLLVIWNEERKKSLGDTSEFHDTKIMYPLAVEAIRRLIQSEDNSCRA